MLSIIVFYISIVHQKNEALSQLNFHYQINTNIFFYLLFINNKQTINIYN